VVRIGTEEMEECYRIAMGPGNVAGDSEGRVSLRRLGDVLETVVRSRAAAVG